MLGTAARGRPGRSGSFGYSQTAPTFPVTEDHGTFVTAAAASHSGAGAEQLGTAAGRPVHGRGVGGSRGMSRVGINMVQPPRHEVAAGMFDCGR